MKAAAKNKLVSGKRGAAFKPCKRVTAKQNTVYQETILYAIMQRIDITDVS